MQLDILYVAVFFVAVKIAATIWLACQPDATTVTATLFGRIVYFSGKISPALFVATMFARAYVRGAPSSYLVFWAVLFVVAVVMAIIVVRQRSAGTWFGYAHEMKQRRRRRLSR